MNFSSLLVAIEINIIFFSILKNISIVFRGTQVANHSSISLLWFIHRVSSAFQKHSKV